MLVMLALLAVAAQPGPAPAQPPRFDAAAPENRQVLPAFSYETVEPVLTQIGARFERQISGERPALLVTFANGRRAAILFGACQGSSCKAISVQAVWNRPADLPPERLGAGLHAFNQRYGFARAFVTSDGRPTLQRYLVADFGFVRGNLAVELLAFAGQIDRFVGEVLRAPAAPAPAG